MKIVQLITAFQLGGAEKVAMDIALGVKSSSYDIELISIFKHNSQFSIDMKKKLDNNHITYKELGIDIKYNKLKYFGLLISIIQMCIYLIKNKPEIVHSHTDFPDFVLSNVMKLFSFLTLKKPKIVRTIHNTQLWPTHKKIAYFVEKSFQNDSVVFISYGAKDAYISLRKECNLEISKKTFFIYNGVNTKTYINKCSNDFLKENDIYLSTNKTNFLFVGRFVEQKGFDLMLEAFALIDSKILEYIEIYAFGSGELEKMLHDNKYSRLPLKIFPPVANIHLLYACFNVLIMPSRFEGLPLVALEALSSKLPVIASDAPGLNEAIPIGWPLQFENGNINEIEKIIMKVIQKNIDLNMIKEDGRKFVEDKFDIDKMIHAYLNVYTENRNFDL